MVRFHWPNLPKKWRKPPVFLHFQICGSKRPNKSVVFANTTQISKRTWHDALLTRFDHGTGFSGTAWISTINQLKTWFWTVL